MKKYIIFLISLSLTIFSCGKDNIEGKISENITTKIDKIQNLNLDCSITKIILENSDTEDFEVNIGSKDKNKNISISHTYKNNNLSIFTTTKNAHIFNKKENLNFLVKIKGPIGKISNIVAYTNVSALTINNATINTFTLNSNVSKIDINHSKLLNNNISLNVSKLDANDVILGPTNIEANVSQIRIKASNYDEITEKNLININKNVTKYKLEK